MVFISEVGIKLVSIYFKRGLHLFSTQGMLVL